MAISMRCARLGAALMVVLCLAPAMAVARTVYEPDPTFRASDILTRELRGGKGWSVEETVRNNGLLNTYEIQTDEGPITVHSTALLRIRADELEILNELEAIERSDAYREALAKAAESPVSFARHLVTDPSGALSSDAHGAGQFLENLGQGLFAGKNAEDESAVETALGVASAKRAFSKAFGVDPYSRNPFLQERLDRLAWASAVGGLNVDVALGLLPDPVGNAMRTTTMTGEVGDLIYANSPKQLLDILAEKLRNMGIPTAIADAFLGHPKFTPTEKVRIVAALERMPEVENRQLFFDLATLAGDPTQTFLRLQVAEMLAAYQQQVMAGGTLVRLGRHAMLLNPSDELIVAVPGDYLAWTKGLSSGAQRAQAATGNPVAGISGRQVMVAGEISPLARTRLESFGWTVNENALDPLKMN